jgi:hypothetical protein
LVVAVTIIAIAIVAIAVVAIASGAVAVVGARIGILALLAWKFALRHDGGAREQSQRDQRAYWTFHNVSLVCAQGARLRRPSAALA